MKRRTQVALAVAVLVGTLAALSALAAKKTPKFTKGAEQAAQIITGSLLRAHTAFLSDDLLEGRGPGTRGGELAAKYVAAEFARMGLEPGGDAGSYFQKVALLGKKLDAPADLRVVGRRQAAAFKYFDDFVPFSGLEDKQVEAEGELVFAGYGIVAPEYKWDDFKGTDVRDKILLILVNDPPATSKEPELFGGKALTYYGRWTYKYEQAACLGAAGAILIHTTESAGYPFSVVQSSWTGEQFELLREGQAEGPLELKAWITDAAARRLLALAGQDLDSLRKAAAERSFRPVALGLRAATELNQTRRVIDTANVIGVLPGTNPKLKDEYVIYTAHYDHLGVGKPVNDDAIYNGAADNSIGVAALLGIAEAMTRLAGGSGRTQVFAAVAAEEAGLLGSAYYARHPVFPPAQTVANINMDGLNQWGPTRDIVEVGSGKSELDEVAEAVARRHNLKLLPDQFPEKGFFYRSDQFSLAKIGIPALYFDNGLDVVGKPAGYGKQKFEEYTANNYHQPSDEIKPDWDWSGAEQMARYIYECGWLAANWARDFNWYKNAEFRAARLESLKKGKK